MRLRNVTLRNFLTVGDDPVTITIDEGLTTIVGPNSAGKTTLFRAIGFLSDIFSNRITSAFEEYVAPYYHRGADDKPIEIHVQVALSQDEKNILKDFLVCASLNSVMNRGQERAQPVEKEVVFRYGDKFFAGLFDDITFVAKVFQKRHYPTVAAVKLDDTGLVIHQFGSVTNSISRPRTRQAIPLPDLLYQDFLREKKDQVNPYVTGQSDEFDISGYEPKNMKELASKKLNDEGIGIDIQGLSFADFESRLESILRIENLPELRRLERFLRKRRNTNEGTTITDVLNTIYDSNLVEIVSLRCPPQKVFLGDNSDTSLEYTGNQMVRLLFDLRNSIDADDRNAYSSIQNAFFDLTGFQFEVFVTEKQISETQLQTSLIKPTPGNLGFGSQIPSYEAGINLWGTRETPVERTVHELTISFVKESLVVPIDLAASGLFESLYVLSAIIGTRDRIVLLDEPASNLHPNFQRKVLNIIKKKTIGENGNQVVVITHSPYVIDSKARNIWCFNMNNNTTRAVSFTELSSHLTPNDSRQVERYFSSPDFRSLLFAKGVVFVEGASDKIVLELLDAHLTDSGTGPRLAENEWGIMDLGGKDTMRLFLEVTSSLGIPYTCVVDYDALMRCEREVQSQAEPIRTSSVFSSLYSVGILGENDVESLRKWQLSTYKVKNSKGVDETWYEGSETMVDTLRTLALKHHVFVFKSDLEGVLQTPSTGKKRKPLRSVDAFLEVIEDNRIPQEFLEMSDFLKTYTTKSIP